MLALYFLLYVNEEQTGSILHEMILKDKKKTDFGGCLFNFKFVTEIGKLKFLIC